MGLSYGDLSAADVAAVTRNNGGGDGMGFGGGCFWIIVLFLFALMGGLNNGFGGGNGGNGGNGYPMMQQGFDQAAVMNSLGQINSSINQGFNGVEAAANARQIADMQSNFAMQTSMLQGFNGIQAQQANCCCENRLATANLSADIAREACATRTSDTQNTQLILNAINDGFRAMSDQRYQDKIDAKNDEIAQLRQDNLYARGQAFQIAQNQQIVDSIYNRLDTCPVGTTPVFGRTPIFSCNGNGCGCNNNTFMN